MKFHSLDAAWDRDDFFILDDRQGCLDLFPQATFQGLPIQFQANNAYSFQDIAERFAQLVASEAGIFQFYDSLTGSNCTYWLQGGRIHRENTLLPAEIVEHDKWDNGKLTRHYYCVWYLDGRRKQSREYLYGYLPENYLC